MRNLVEYPITREEIINNLKEVIQYSEKRNHDLIPDMETFLLKEALKIIEKEE